MSGALGALRSVPGDVSPLANTIGVRAPPRQGWARFIALNVSAFIVLRWVVIKALELLLVFLGFICVKKGYLIALRPLTLVVLWSWPLPIGTDPPVRITGFAKDSGCCLTQQLLPEFGMSGTPGNEADTNHSGNRRNDPRVVIREAFRLVLEVSDEPTEGTLFGHKIGRYLTVDDQSPEPSANHRVNPIGIPFSAFVAIPDMLFEHSHNLIVKLLDPRNL